MTETENLAATLFKLRSLRECANSLALQLEGIVKSLSPEEFSQYQADYEKETINQLGITEDDFRKVEIKPLFASEQLKEACTAAIVGLCLPFDHSASFKVWNEEQQSVVVCCRGEYYEIDVFESISANFWNLFHPIITWALKSELLKLSAPALRVTSLPSYPRDIVEKKLFSAIRKGLKGVWDFAPPHIGLAHLSELQPFDGEYLLKAHGILSSERVWDVGGKERIYEEAWKEHVLYRLNSEIAGFDHDPLMNFLLEGLLPASAKFESFANSFNHYGYNKRMTIESYKNKVSEVRQSLLKATGINSLEDVEGVLLELEISDKSWIHRVANGWRPEGVRIAPNRDITTEGMGLALRPVSSQEFAQRFMTIEQSEAN